MASHSLGRGGGGQVNAKIERRCCCRSALRPLGSRHAQWLFHQLEVAALNRKDGQYERSMVDCSNWQFAHQNLCSRPRHGIIPVSRTPFTVSHSCPRLAACTCPGNPSRRQAPSWPGRSCRVARNGGVRLNQTRSTRPPPPIARVAGVPSHHRDFGKASAKAPHPSRHPPLQKLVVLLV
jgi:hypothetical protein